MALIDLGLADVLERHVWILAPSTAAIELTPGAPAAITLTADPTSLPADGKATPRVTGVVTEWRGKAEATAAMAFLATQVMAQDFPLSGLSYPCSHHHRHAHDPAIVPDFEARGIQPQVRVGPLKRTVALYQLLRKQPKVLAEAKQAVESGNAKGLLGELEMAARAAQEPKERQKIRALHRDLARRRSRTFGYSYGTGAWPPKGIRGWAQQKAP